MGYAWLDIELNVDESRGSLGDLAYLWFDELVKRLAGAESAIRRSPDGAEGPRNVNECITITRYIRGLRKERVRKLSGKSFDWLREELSSTIPSEAEVRFVTTTRTAVPSSFTWAQESSRWTDLRVG